MKRWEGDQMEKKRMRKLGWLVSLVALVWLVTSTTHAWLVERTTTLENSLLVGKVDNEIIEEFDQQVKKNVTVKNTGNITAFIRVKVIPSWLEPETGVTLGLPAEGTYSLSFNETDWFESAGYWYHRQPVASQGETSVLIYEGQPQANLATAYEGKQFKLEIMTQSVQSEPLEGVIELWGMNPQANN